MFGRGKNVVASVRLYLISIDTLCAEIVSNFAIIPFFVSKRPLETPIHSIYARRHREMPLWHKSQHIFHLARSTHKASNRYNLKKYSTVEHCLFLLCTVPRVPCIILQHHGKLVLTSIGKYFQGKRIMVLNRITSYW